MTALSAQSLLQYTSHNFETVCCFISLHLSGSDQDVYCFELLSMVLALSGSSVGRAYLAQQYPLLQDLFSLLHTGTPRVQRQVSKHCTLSFITKKIADPTCAVCINIEKNKQNKIFCLFANELKETLLKFIQIALIMSSASFEHHYLTEIPPM